MAGSRLVLEDTARLVYALNENDVIYSASTLVVVNRFLPSQNISC